MGVKDDRDEFNNSGWRGVLKQMLAARREGYIKLAPRGWLGHEVSQRPAPGSGPFIQVRQQGEPPLRFRNSAPGDTSSEELGRWEM